MPTKDTTATKKPRKSTQVVVEPGADSPEAGMLSQPGVIELPGVTKLSKDLKVAAKTVSLDEARFLVDSYYTMQDNRIRANNQVRALTESEEPHEVLLWLSAQNSAMEKGLLRALDAFSDAHVVGNWAKSIIGIGPVISAGLLAHIDITQAPTVGHIWNFAGLNSNAVWLGEKAASPIINAVVDGSIIHRGQLIDIAKAMGACPKWLSRRIYKSVAGVDKPVMGFTESVTDETYVNTVLEGIEFSRRDIIMAVSKRPWNTQLKTLCWKIGESFVKVSGNPDSMYGRFYAERKQLEIARNSEKQFASQAQEILSKKRIGKDTKAYAAYSTGHLPDGHIHARAKRFAVKMFLSHWHEIAYEAHYGVKPVAPYAIAIDGHGHYIPASEAS